MTFDRVLDIVEQGDVCSTLVLIVILLVLGRHMATGRPAIESWGLRLAAASFIAYVAYGGFTEQPGIAADWVAIVFRGLLLSALVLGISWIVLTGVAFVCHYTIASPLLKLRNVVNNARYRVQARRQSHAWEGEQRRRNRDEAERRICEREQAQNESAAQRRRIDARARAALNYSIYAPKLGDRFTKDMFDRYVADFMGDDQLPEDLERRAEQLLSILQQHLVQIDPPKEAMTLDGLARWYEDQSRRIDASPLDARRKNILQAQLNTRYAEITTNLLESLEP